MATGSHLSVYDKKHHITCHYENENKMRLHAYYMPIKSKTLTTPNDGSVTPKNRPKISHMGESLKIIQRRKKKKPKIGKR